MRGVGKVLNFLYDKSNFDYTNKYINRDENRELVGYSEVWPTEIIYGYDDIVELLTRYTELDRSYNERYELAIEAKKIRLSHKFFNKTKSSISITSEVIDNINKVLNLDESTIKKN